MCCLHSAIPSDSTYLFVDVKEGGSFLNYQHIQVYTPKILFFDTWAGTYVYFPSGVIIASASWEFSPLIVTRCDFILMTCFASSRHFHWGRRHNVCRNIWFFSIKVHILMINSENTTHIIWFLLPSAYRRGSRNSARASCFADYLWNRGVLIGAQVHMRIAHMLTPFPYLENDWTHLVETWWVVRDPLATHFT